MGNQNTRARPPLTQPRAAAKIKTRLLRDNPHASSTGLKVENLISLVTAALEVLAKHGDSAHPSESYEVVLQAAQAMALLYGNPETQRFLRRAPTWIAESLDSAEKVLGLRKRPSRAT